MPGFVAMVAIETYSSFKREKIQMLISFQKEL
jgi:hypothetical protein